MNHTRAFGFVTEYSPQAANASRSHNFDNEFYFVFEIINGQNMLGLLLGVIPGIITLVLSIVTKEKIGLGDGLILICVGCLQTIKDVLCMIFFSFIFLTVVLIFLLAIRRIGRSSRIPFVPFLFLGQLITMYGGIL